MKIALFASWQRWQYMHATRSSVKTSSPVEGHHLLKWAMAGVSLSTYGLGVYFGFCWGHKLSKHKREPLERFLVCLVLKGSRLSSCAHVYYLSFCYRALKEGKKQTGNTRRNKCCCSFWNILHIETSKMTVSYTGARFRIIEMLKYSNPCECDISSSLLRICFVKL